MANKAVKHKQQNWNYGFAIIWNETYESIKNEDRRGIWAHSIVSVFWVGVEWPSELKLHYLKARIA